MKFLLPILFAAAVGAQECVVSEWGDWSECRRPTVKMAEPSDTFKEPVKDEEAYATMMQQIMNKKQEQWDEHTECMAEGRCPDYSTNTARARVDCVGGMAGSYPCFNVDMMAYLSLDDLGYNSPAESPSQTRGNDIWGWTDPVTNDEYAILGLTAGTSFIRVAGSGASPDNPQVIGHLYQPPGAGRSSWRDLKVIGSKVFIVSESSSFGLQIFDLTSLRGRAANKAHTFTNYEHVTSLFIPWYGSLSIRNSHNIVGDTDNEDVILVGGQRSDACAAGLKVYNTVTGEADCFPDDGYVHDAECFDYDGPDTRFLGRQICFCYNENSLTIMDLDVGLLEDPLVARTSYSGVRYTHQGWVTEDREMLLLDDEQDEQNGKNGGRTTTYFWDINSLTNPTFMYEYVSSQTSIDHNLYIDNVGGTEYAYQSNYEAGLRVLQLPGDWLGSPTEVAWFDIYPSRTTTNFQGTWSNYPYFTQGAAGTVAVTSITPPALFILKPNLPAAAEAAAMQDLGWQTRTREVISSNQGQNCPHLEEFRQC